jgi:hypothetical protein
MSRMLVPLKVFGQPLSGTVQIVLLEAVWR